MVDKLDKADREHVLQLAKNRLRAKPSELPQDLHDYANEFYQQRADEHAKLSKGKKQQKKPQQAQQQQQKQPKQQKQQQKPKEEAKAEGEKKEVKAEEKVEKKVVEKKAEEKVAAQATPAQVMGEFGRPKKIKRKTPVTQNEEE